MELKLKDNEVNEFKRAIAVAAIEANVSVERVAGQAIATILAALGGMEEYDHKANERRMNVLCVVKEMFCFDCGKVMGHHVCHCQNDE